MEALEIDDEDDGLFNALKRPESEKKEIGTEPTTFFSAFKDILNRSLLMISGLVLMNIMDVISLYFVGWLNNTTMLAGVGLGIVIMNIVIVSILQGSIRGMEKLIQMSLEKEDDIEMMCRYMARGRAILIALWVPLAAFLYFSYPVLVMIKQTPEVATEAVNYMHFALPGILFKANFDYIRRYILQHKMKKQTNWAYGIIGLSTLAHFYWCNLFICKWGWGVEGAGLALTLTYGINCVLLYIVSYSYYES